MQRDEGVNFTMNLQKRASTTAEQWVSHAVTSHSLGASQVLTGRFPASLRNKLSVKNRGNSYWFQNI